ncbi:MAG: hypothetical protein QM538_00400 [Methylacidiphilales bacterium]|nr:hypothetical protein [Candidatus Methylacidiphilales bacterium]
MINKKRKVLFVTGEASGDAYASQIILVLNSINTSVSYYAIGGEMLKNAGANILFNYLSIQAFGFLQAIKKYWKITNILKKVCRWIELENPDVIILVDNWGFNSLLAKHIKKKTSIKIFYIIPPKVWAWNISRVAQLNKISDCVAVIFPFEVSLLSTLGCDNVFYAGNPLLEIYQLESIQLNQRNENRVIIGLIPGSRKSEVDLHLPLLNEVVDRYFKKNIDSQVDFIIPCDVSIKSIYESVLVHPRIKILYGKFSSIVQKCNICVTASGTASLEVALCLIPQIVFYKSGFVDSLILRKILTTQSISLPNILLSQKYIPELIFENATSSSILSHLSELLANKFAQSTQVELSKSLYSILQSDSLFSKQCANQIKLFLS